MSYHAKKTHTHKHGYTHTHTETLSFGYFLHYVIECLVLKTGLIVVCAIIPLYQLKCLGTDSRTKKGKPFSFYIKATNLIHPVGLDTTLNLAKGLDTTLNLAKLVQLSCCKPARIGHVWSLSLVLPPNDRITISLHKFAVHSILRQPLQKEPK